ncbi:hypothetical protein EH30_12925 [Erythrobacter sp. JL475]|nr:hypothetical protein EH30_12925 [Erythrobacter sp. JL475]
MDLERFFRLAYTEEELLEDIEWIHEFWSVSERQYRDADGFVVDWEAYEKLNEERIKLVLLVLIDRKPSHPIWKIVTDYDQLVQNIIKMSKDWELDESLAADNPNITEGAIRIAEAIWAFESLAGYPKIGQAGKRPLEAA